MKYTVIELTLMYYSVLSTCHRPEKLASTQQFMLRMLAGLNISPLYLVPFSYWQITLIKISCENLGLWVWQVTWLTTSSISGYVFLEKYWIIPTATAYIHLSVSFGGEPSINVTSGFWIARLSLVVQPFMPLSTKIQSMWSSSVNMIVLLLPVPVLSIYIPRNPVILLSSYSSSNLRSQNF